MNTPLEQQRTTQVDCYVNGRMSDYQRQSFEIAMMEDPDLLHEVQIADAMKRGLATHADLLNSTPRTSESVLPFRLWLRQPFSLAASLAVAVMAVGLFVEQAGKRDISPPGDSATTSIATLLVFERTRGDGLLEFSGAPPYLLQIDAGVENSSRNLSVDLSDVTGEEPLLQAQATADADGWIRLTVTSSLPDQFSVRLFNNQGETIQRYNAHITR